MTGKTHCEGAGSRKACKSCELGTVVDTGAHSPQNNPFLTKKTTPGSLQGKLMEVLDLLTS